ncbi:MAG TPA: DUF167 domain-containing protein [Candidatus Akkermansia intestinigallinarum]|uniref:UPF0235 protein H9862_06205 n=1 Tax=Candidatus Akkermansia intestinigallinarum TaxID=2838431 RepID=A0A9D1VBL4_9BACT|nr:DUF167 domain-containing protein [Candidatus Akkermansia intestinigallinarum]
MKLALKVTPGARRSECLGWEEDYPGIGRVLRLRIAAPPVEGKANKALVDYLAQQLKLPRGSVSLQHGSSRRIKLIELPDGTDLSPLG